MKTIKDYDYSSWCDLDYDEKLDVTMNTMFCRGLINTPEEMDIGDSTGVIELACVDDEKKALEEGWIKINCESVEIDLDFGGDLSPLVDEELLYDSIFYYLEALEDR